MCSQPNPSDRAVVSFGDALAKPVRSTYRAVAPFGNALAKPVRSTYRALLSCPDNIKWMDGECVFVYRSLRPDILVNLPEGVRLKRERADPLLLGDCCFWGEVAKFLDEYLEQPFQRVLMYCLARG